MMIFLCRMHIQSTIARANLGRQQATDTHHVSGSGGCAAGSTNANDHHMTISLLLVGTPLTRDPLTRDPLPAHPTIICD